MLLRCPEILAKGQKGRSPSSWHWEIILFRPNKGITWYSPLETYIAPSLFIMYCITWMFSFIKEKTAQWENKSSVWPWICVTTQSVLDAYIVVGEESLRVWYQPPSHACQFPYAMRNPTHWIFVRLIVPLCVIIHWDWPLKREIKPTLLPFQNIPSPLNSYFFSFGF